MADDISLPEVQLLPVTLQQFGQIVDDLDDQLDRYQHEGRIVAEGHALSRALDGAIAQGFNQSSFYYAQPNDNDRSTQWYMYVERLRGLRSALGWRSPIAQGQDIQAHEAPAQHTTVYYYEHCGRCWCARPARTWFLPVFEDDHAVGHFPHLPDPNWRFSVPTRQLFRTQCYECASSEASALVSGRPEDAHRSSLQQY